MESDLATRLRAFDLPPGLDTTVAVAAGRRSARRRRRVLTGLGAVLVIAATGVTYAAVVPGRGSTPPADRPPVVVPLEPTRGAPLANCARTDLPLPAGLVAAARATVTSDPSGRHLLVDVAEAGTGAPRQVLWDDAGVTPLDPITRWITVNSRGVVAGADSPSASGVQHSYVLRDGVVRQLGVPDGYLAAVPVAVNDRGDIFGTLTRDAVFGDGPAGGGYNFHTVPGQPRDLDLVYWPANAPDKPRVVPESGEAEALGFGPDGRMYATVDGVLHAWRPNLTGGPVPMPAGWAPFAVERMVGGFVYGSFGPPRVDPDPGAVFPSAAVRLFGYAYLARWDLRVNRIEVLDERVRALAGAGPDGSVAYSTIEQNLLLTPDGVEHEISALGLLLWVAGGDVVAQVRDTPSVTTVVRWRCP